MKKPRRYHASQLLLLWHKHTGLYAAIFIILLSVSGIALNHTQALKLNQHYLSSNWLLDHYNVAEPLFLKHFPVKKGAVYQVDDLLIFNDKVISSLQQSLIGAVQTNGYTVAALGNELLLIDDTYHLAARFSQADGVPTQLKRIGLSENQQLVFDTGKQLLSVDEGFFEWAPFRGSAISWSTAQAVDNLQHENLVQQYRSHIIHYETLILDLHSGRFFGQYGELFFDFIAGLLIFLALSGIVVWSKSRPKARN